MNQFSRPQDLLCSEVQDTLEAYLAAELDAETHARIAAHVTSCPKCQDEVHFAQTISEALHELPRLEPPPKVFDAVEAYVRAHPDKGERWWHRLFQLSTFWDNLTFSLVRVGAVVCLFGIVAFGIYQYQQHQKIMQASRDLNYVLSKLNYAVERTGIVVKEKLPNVQIDETSQRPFVRIEEASRRALKQKQNISSAIHRSLDSLNRLPENALDTEHNQNSQQEGETQ
ncbi:hypothetical protein F4Y59_04295 [Candidatus Poribacteria bacterium]|nr:hypothetical protein [Candidatus Poribacteria bacterium]MYK18183.1 hypothetical protein [Candidatus Poribacteria bacterium]